MPINEQTSGLRRPGPSGTSPSDRLRLAALSLDRRRVVALILAILVSSVVFSSISRSRSTVAELGQRVDVLVVRSPVAAGEQLIATDVSIEQRPIGLLPDSPPAARADGRVARVALIPGEILMEDRLFPDDGHLDPGQRMITIPLPLTVPLIEIGHEVDLVGLLPSEGPVRRRPEILARARVVALTDDSVSVAVEERNALTVVEHLVLGTIEIVALP